MQLFVEPWQYLPSCSVEDRYGRLEKSVLMTTRREATLATAAATKQMFEQRADLGMSKAVSFTSWPLLWRPSKQN